MRRTITSENKLNDFSADQVNEVLRESVANKYQKSGRVILIHDPSEIRKRHTKTAENIGRVKSLDNRIINGYSSFNTVVVEPETKQISLVQHELYSNRQAEFLSATAVKELEANQFTGDAQTKALYESGKYLTSKKIAFDQISSASMQLKSNNSDLSITHVLDREFDDGAFFSHIVEQNDEFVIRGKKSRTVSGLSGDEKATGKLINHQFSESMRYRIQKLYLSGKCYQDCVVELDWECFGEYRAVRVKLVDRKGKLIFEDPMLLLTNKQIHNGYDAYHVYDCYLKRSRIEGVFKFIKEGMDWEEFRLKDFEGIKALVAIAFYVASYLYEITQEQVYDDFVVLVAEIGGAKQGQVTRHYILEGIKSILTKYRVDRVFVRHQPDKSTLSAIHDMAGYHGD